MTYKFDNKEFSDLESYLMAQNWTRAELQQIAAAKRDDFIENGKIDKRLRFYDWCASEWGLNPLYVAQLWGVSYTPLTEKEKERLFVPQKAEKITAKRPDPQILFREEAFDNNYTAVQDFVNAHTNIKPELAAAAYLWVRGEDKLDTIRVHLDRLGYVPYSDSAIKSLAQRNGFESLEEVYLKLVDQ